MTMRRRAILALMPTLGIRAVAAQPAASATAEMLSTAGPLTVQPRREDWLDAARSRNLAVQLYLPQPDSAREGLWPLIVFSHGLGGSRDGGKALASRGA